MIAGNPGSHSRMFFSLGKWLTELMDFPAWEVVTSDAYHRRRAEFRRSKTQLEPHEGSNAMMSQKKRQLFLVSLFFIPN